MCVELKQMACNVSAMAMFSCTQNADGLTNYDAPDEPILLVFNSGYKEKMMEWKLLDVRHRFHSIAYLPPIILCTHVKCALLSIFSFLALMENVNFA